MRLLPFIARWLHAVVIVVTISLSPLFRCLSLLGCAIQTHIQQQRQRQHNAKLITMLVSPHDEHTQTKTYERTYRKTTLKLYIMMRPYNTIPLFPFLGVALWLSQSQLKIPQKRRMRKEQWTREDTRQLPSLKAGKVLARLQKSWRERKRDTQNKNGKKRLAQPRYSFYCIDRDVRHMHKVSSVTNKGRNYTNWHMVFALYFQAFVLLTSLTEQSMQITMLDFKLGQNSTQTHRQHIGDLWDKE